jgi:hypothetical protein
MQQDPRMNLQQNYQPPGLGSLGDRLNEGYEQNVLGANPNEIYDN